MAAVDSVSWSQPVSFLGPWFSQPSREDTEALNPRLPFGSRVLGDHGTLETCLPVTFNLIAELVSSGELTKRQTLRWFQWSESVIPQDYPLTSKCPPARHLLSTYTQELGMISHDPRNSPVRSCKPYPLHYRCRN